MCPSVLIIMTADNAEKKSDKKSKPQLANDMVDMENRSRQDICVLERVQGKHPIHPGCPLHLV